MATPSQIATLAILYHLAPLSLSSRHYLPDSTSYIMCLFLLLLLKYKSRDGGDFIGLNRCPISSALKCAWPIKDV